MRALVARAVKQYDRSLTIDQRVNATRERTLARHRYGHGRGGDRPGA
jgi:hypothetical protein